IGTYPYGIGHLREYKNALDYAPGSTDTSFSIAQTCSRTNPSSPCNWDANDYIKGGGTRNLYAAFQSGGVWSLVKLTGSNANQIAQMMYNTTSPTTGATSQTQCATNVINMINGAQYLGGVDYSTPAVIE